MNKSELLEELRNIDEVALLELLEITSSELVDAFLDKIDDNIDKLYAKAREEKEDES
jgi:hypothetical protein